MVECEFFVDTVDWGWFVVLIDTWWNVNYIHRSAYQRAPRVLIDTWWNVNKIFRAALLPTV